MKWIMLAVISLAALVAIVALIGARLPRTHSATRSLSLRRPPADVWPVLMQTPSASDVPVDVLESNPPLRLVTRVKATEKMFGGTWTVTITPQRDRQDLRRGAGALWRMNVGGLKVEV